MAKPVIAIIGGSGLGAALAEKTTGQTVNVDTPYGPPSRPAAEDRDGWPDHLLPGPPRPRPHLQPLDRPLPREHLRPQEGRRHAHPRQRRRRQPPRGHPPQGPGHPRPGDRQDLPPAAARSSTSPASPPTWSSPSRSAPPCASAADRSGRRRPDNGPPSRHVRLHGRPAVLHAGRERDAPAVGRRPDRHDLHARGQARPRGRDVLRA